MASGKRIMDWLVAMDVGGNLEGAMTADGLDDAILGLMQIDGLPVIAYSSSRVVNILMERDSMTYEEAVEFFQFNIESVAGTGQFPVFVDDFGINKECSDADS